MSLAQTHFVLSPLSILDGNALDPLDFDSLSLFWVPLGRPSVTPTGDMCRMKDNVW